MYKMQYKPDNPSLHITFLKEIIIQGQKMQKTAKMTNFHLFLSY
eukprot:UN07014